MGTHAGRIGFDRIPFHWGSEQGENGSANDLTIPAIDRIAKQPEFEYGAVRLAETSVEPESVAAFLGFLAFALVEASGLVARTWVSMFPGKSGVVAVRPTPGRLGATGGSVPPT